VNIAGQLVLTLIDAVIFTLLFHRLAGVDVSLRDAAVGGLAASVGFTVLKLSASVLLQVAVRNRFLAAFGLVVGLLVWMNLVARVTLVAGALSATVAADRGHLALPDPAVPAGVRGAAREVTDTAAGEGADPASEAHRAARILLGAGFVAGALVAWALSAARRRAASR
jgi:membrane protein